MFSSPGPSYTASVKSVSVVGPWFLPPQRHGEGHLFKTAEWMLDVMLREGSPVPGPLGGEVLGPSQGKVGQV